MEQSRKCEQCGREFEPRREHARFCSARCRMAWNAEHGGAAATPVVALDWSITAMTEAADRLARATAWELPGAVVAVSEATWWVTIVDATLVRYHPRTYDAVLASRSPGYRRETEETLAGLRYVRNQMGQRLDPAGFIRPSAQGRSRAGAAAWLWNPLPEPAGDSLTPHGDEWELIRYRAYQARLADGDVAATFALTTSFLGQTAMLAAAFAPVSERRGDSDAAAARTLPGPIPGPAR